MLRSPHVPTARTAALVFAAALVLPLTACGADDPDGRVPAPAPPDRSADVEGAVDLDEDEPRLVDASDGYYEGMPLLSASTVVLDADGTRVDADALVDGDVVEVWAEVCAESFPVQCEVVAVRVVG